MSVGENAAGLTATEKARFTAESKNETLSKKKLAKRIGLWAMSALGLVSSIQIDSANALDMTTPVNLIISDRVGNPRTVRISRPTVRGSGKNGTVQTNRPLIIFLHGGQGGENTMFTEWQDNADNRDAVLVTIRGRGANPAHKTPYVYDELHRNAVGIEPRMLSGGVVNEEVFHDVKFVSKVASHINGLANYTNAINTSKVYVTGHSKGTGLAWGVYCYFGANIKSFAFVSNGFNKALSNCNGTTFETRSTGTAFIKSLSVSEVWTTPKPIYYQHGTAEANLGMKAEWIAGAVSVTSREGDNPKYCELNAFTRDDWVPFGDTCQPHADSLQVLRDNNNLNNTISSQANWDSGARQTDGDTCDTDGDNGLLDCAGDQTFERMYLYNSPPNGGPIQYVQVTNGEHNYPRGEETNTIDDPFHSEDLDTPYRIVQFWTTYAGL